MRLSAREIVNKSKPQAGDWFRIENKDTPSGEKSLTRVEIYDEIGFWGTDAATFAGQLKDIKTDVIELHVNSPGGEIFDGVAIYNALKSHKAEVRVIIDSLAASAASFIAQAGDKVYMTRNATMMIHDGAGVVFGNAADMHAMANLLDKLSDNIADIYAQRAGRTLEDWRASMRAETWYSASEAVEAGLADEVLDYSDKEAETVSNSWDKSLFRNKIRGDAGSPQILEELINTLTNRAKEAVVSKPNAVVNENTPVEETPPAEVTPPVNEAPPVEAEDAESFPPVVPPPASGGVVNQAPEFSVLINGVSVTDPRVIQARIDALETAQREARDGARNEFVEQLVTSNRLPATEREATVTFALELSDAQYESWQRQWNNAASLPLLARHGEGSTNHAGDAAASESAAADEIAVCIDIVKHHLNGGRSKEFVATTPNYKRLMSLKPDFQL